MGRILSRLLVRLALVIASLAWIAFVFTQTVGDPDRGEEIARAVLADPAARAEVRAPVTDGVMSSFGIPSDQRSLVETQVDQLLRTPTGSEAFIDPFAGSWSRLLGEDDQRPAEFDLAPLLTQFAAATGALPEGVTVPERVPVPGVPLPRTQLDWMAGVRSAVDAAVAPMALAAATLFAVAFAMGERPRVLRRLGIWALVAGGTWLVIPAGVVWVARRWAPGADAVVAASLDAATSGLIVAATLLIVVGVLAVALSFVVVAAERERPAGPRARESSGRDVPAAPAAVAPVRRITDTAEMPTVVYQDAQQAPTPPIGAPRPAEPHPTADAVPVDDEESVWEYYA